MLVRETLLAVVGDPEGGADRLARLSPDDRGAVLEAGASQGLGTALAVACRSRRLEVPPWLERHRFEMATRRGHILATLGRLAPALTGAGVPWVVLKGPVVAARYPEPALREYLDLDLLVPGSRLGDALEAAGDAGMSRLNRNWESALRYGVGEFPLYLGPTPVDLHWSLVGLGRDRRRFRLSTAEMLARRTPTIIAGTPAWQLDEEDNALHVALHAGLSGAWRLDRLRDIQQLAGSGTVRWDVVADRARRCRLGPIVGLVLDRARRVLDAAVPPQVPARLAPASGLRLLRVADARLRRGKPYAGLVVAVARDGVGNTLGAARERLGERAAARLGRPPRWSAFDPGSPLYWESHGDPAAYEEYLALAARAG